MASWSHLGEEINIFVKFRPKTTRKMYQNFCVFARQSFHSEPDVPCYRLTQGIIEQICNKFPSLYSFLSFLKFEIS